MYEKLIKRTIWEARCDCGAEPSVRTENPPRERQCPSCGKWVKFVENSVIGPDLGKPS